MADGAEGLFGECTVYFVPSRSLAPTQIAEVSALKSVNITC